MELIESIKDTIGKRVNSAFSGTFILVWIGFNWRLIFILLNFDADFNFYDRLMWVDNYFLTSNKWQTLYYPIIWTFVSYIAYQVFNTITYGISSLTNLQLKPWILSRIKEVMIVPREDYLKLDKLYIELEISSKISHERLINSETNKKTIETEKEELNKKIIEQNNFAESQKQIIDNNTKKQKEVMNGAIADWNKAKEAFQKDYLDLTETLRKTKESSLLFIETKNSFDGTWQITIDTGDTSTVKDVTLGHFYNLSSESGGVFSNLGNDLLKEVKILEYDNNLYKFTYSKINKQSLLFKFYLFKIDENFYYGISTSHSTNGKPHSITLRNTQQ